MTDEEWVKEATGDDAVVAELLLRFKQVKPKTEPEGTTSKRALSVEWSVRQRRSKAVMVHSKKQALRASPTTPLSWSGATSISGGGGGGGASGSGAGGGAFDGGPEEESSRPSPPPSGPPKRSDTPRSKVIGTSETTSTKRSRRKKTLAELKEEENLLQKERRQLKRELATVHLKLEKARTTNEKLKKMKLELQQPPAAESASVSPVTAASDQLQQKIESAAPIPAISPPIVAGLPQCTPPNGCSKGEEEAIAGQFVLPDLNLPFEET